MVILFKRQESRPSQSPSPPAPPPPPSASLSSSIVVTPVTATSSSISTATPTFTPTSVSFSPSTITISPTPSSSNASSSSARTTGMMVAGALVGIFMLLTLLSCVYVTYIKPRFKNKNATSEKPTNSGSQAKSKTKSNAKSKSFGNWWRISSRRGSYSSRLQPSTTSLEQDDTRTGMNGSNVDLEMEAGRTRRPNSTATNQNLDHRASVRSVMTLPMYSSTALPSEQVLGREGERDGIDIVVEHPETFDEEEDRREEEMNSLFQIRQARRVEVAERENRRRRRHEATQRGDNRVLASVLDETRRAQRERREGTNLSSQLIAEHNSRSRDRRISSVQYHELGVAKHDGSRLRATSVGSDKQLISSAASIGTGGRTYSSTSHQRDGSVSSQRSRGSSIDSRNNENYESMPLNRSRSSSLLQPLELTETPPDYENAVWGNAPPYESPTRSTAPQLPTLTSVPSIQIVSPHSPITASAHSPITGNEN